MERLSPNNKPLLLLILVTGVLRKAPPSTTMSQATLLRWPMANLFFFTQVLLCLMPTYVQTYRSAPLTHSTPLHILDSCAPQYIQAR